MSHWIVNQFPTFRKIHVWWRDQLTTVGKVIFLVTVFSLPALADSDAVLAIVFMAGFMILLVANATSRLYRPCLAIKVTCPKSWMRCECRALRIEITNQSSNPVFDLHLNLLPLPGIWEIIESNWSTNVLHSGQTVTISSTVKALRRGLFRLPNLQATTLFPLRLLRRSEEYQLPRRALILPCYRPLRSFNLAESAPGLTRGDTLALRTVGLTGEYIGSREYQPGVPVRRWDYPSWARLGQPVVREYSEPRHSSAAVIVDTCFPAQACGNNQLIPELEAMLALAAAITEALIGQGNRIDLLAIGDRLLADRNSAPGGNQLAILEHLALARPRSANRLGDLTLELERLPVTWNLAIILSHHWDAEQERLFQVVSRRHVKGTRILVRADGRLGAYARHHMLHGVTSARIEAGLVDL